MSVDEDIGDDGKSDGRREKKTQPVTQLTGAGAMRKATVGLGVMCDACHVQDRASDEKPMKVTARMMFAMVKDLNAKFPDGKEHVTCYTCHRGAQTPLTAPPAQ